MISDLTVPYKPMYPVPKARVYFESRLPNQANAADAKNRATD